MRILAIESIHRAQQFFLFLLLAAWIWGGIPGVSAAAGVDGSLRAAGTAPRVSEQKVRGAREPGSGWMESSVTAQVIDEVDDDVLEILAQIATGTLFHRPHDLWALLVRGAVSPRLAPYLRHQPAAHSSVPTAPLPAETMPSREP